MIPPTCLQRLDFEAAELVRSHPPKLKDKHKRAVLELCADPPPAGTIRYSRWDAGVAPDALSAHRAAVAALPDVFDYAGGEAGVWHVNFADPRLFVAYGSSLLAQDELQVLEHPALGSLREALLAAKLPALTEAEGRPTPVLVAGVERRCVLDTAPDLDRPAGLYGNRFSSATWDAVRSALTLLTPPTTSNLIAMAAPVGSGPYTVAHFESILAIAWTAFAAAVGESRAAWPGSPVDVRTGFWGCGAFGGNRTVMVALQILAAHLAGVDRVTFHTVDQGRLLDYEVGARCISGLLGEGSDVAPLLGRMAALGLAWGTSDGN